jgi:hypothetical protein
MRMRIGDILVAMGEITRTQLDDALVRQELSGLQLGAELVAAGCLTPARLASGLQLQRIRVPAIALALAFGSLAANLPAAAADTGSATIAVSANVVRRASMRMLSAAQTVSIAAADIARGYVDIPLPSLLEIRSNSPSGYLIAIESAADYARGTEVRGLGDTVSLGPFGGVVNVKASGVGMKVIPVELRFRVLLSDAARPGIHPWPLQLSVMPL